MSISSLNDDTWGWTAEALNALTKIQERAKLETEQATTLADKLAARDVMRQAIEGRLAVSRVFGKLGRP